ncbi:transporter substrate-binding domain-containing protein [Alicyclobacillus fastidiosus]|uniref:Transporter substrate-binding domain-containing protein n=1 Tax=Alicyclobacillus fastidiosus TaxID=392011 RepID=A0ABY6ZF93_9BACL|nr:GntR family transcriptional regulator YhfZ [Alicyclobacillus fastidiosus]WAH41238.1 transporter substrate-binding domain-containing protein [Alicyclobacillus fastidiosus]
MAEEILFSKNGMAVTKISRELLTYKIGSRVPRIQDFAQKCEVGRGTVQSAIQLLVEAQAVRLESRGHLGTYLLDLDFTKLWEFAGMSTLMGAMPLPYSRRNEGLATGFYAVFEKRNIPFHLSYMRGGSNRIVALVGGRYDLVIMSRRAAELAVKEFDVSVLHSFGPVTYVGAHALLVRDEADKEIRSGMRVGIDVSSFDQKTLTYGLCQGKDVEYVNLPYMQILDELANGTIDAAVWNSDEVEYRFGKSGPIYMYPLNVNEDDATEAAIVVRKADYEIFANLMEQLDMQQINQIQDEVLTGRRVPRY